MHGEGMGNPGAGAGPKGRGGGNSLAIPGWDGTSMLGPGDFGPVNYFD